MYREGERICFWFGDAVTCGVVVAVDTRSDVPHYDVLMDIDDNQPIATEKREQWTVREDDDLWREADGPSAAMREEILNWYHGEPPESMRHWLTNK